MINTQILINHIGYAPKGIKSAIVQSNKPLAQTIQFQIVYNSGQSIFTGVSKETGNVPGWEGRYFAVLDFSSVQQNGRFRISMELEGASIESDVFSIDDHVLFDTLAAPVFRYFKGMRSFEDDRFIPFIDNPTQCKDVSGGWDDASADTGKYLSHLSYGNYLNPQHTPMVVWNICASLDRHPKGYKTIEHELREEAAWGADFLIRMFDVKGFYILHSFYLLPLFIY